MTGWRSPWLRAREAADAIRDRYTTVGELPTPALVADLDAVERNMTVMTASLRGRPVALRPHMKVQKCPDLGLLQVRAGAVGMTAMTVWEAAALAAAGVGDVLIATELAGPDKLRAAAQLARHARLSVVVDNLPLVAELTKAVQAAGSAIDVLVDVDVGMGRTGARSAPAALEVAQAVTAASGLTLAGIQAYEGHCMTEPDPAERARMALASMDYAASVLDLFAREGLPGTVLSASGTVTYGATTGHPAVSEIQAGSYLFMDRVHRDLTTAFEVALTVYATVVARYGDVAILDAGGRSAGRTMVSPPIQGADDGAAYIGSGGDPNRAPWPGERVRLVCGYAPNVINLYDMIFVARGEELVDVWPVFPRGPEHHGFYDALGVVA